MPDETPAQPDAPKKLFDYDFMMSDGRLYTITLKPHEGHTIRETDYGWEVDFTNGNGTTLFRQHVLLVQRRERTLKTKDEYVPAEKRDEKSPTARRTPGGTVLH